MSWMIFCAYVWWQSVYLMFNKHTCRKNTFLINKHCLSLPLISAPVRFLQSCASAGSEPSSSQRTFPASDGSSRGSDTHSSLVKWEQSPEYTSRTVVERTPHRAKETSASPLVDLVWTHLLSAESGRLLLLLPLRKELEWQPDHSQRQQCTQGHTHCLRGIVWCYMVTGCYK